MRRVANVLLAFAILLFPIAVTAQHVQQSSPPMRDAQAMAVLRNSLATMGGQNAVSIHDTVVQASVAPPADVQGTSGTLTITTKGAAMMRVDGSGGGKTASTIFNNGREMRSTDKGFTLAHGANAINKRIEHLPALMLFYELAHGEASATFIGPETVEGRAVNHIRLARELNTQNTTADEIFERNSRLDVFVDAQSNLVAKISYLYIAENDWRQGLPMEIYYSDYRVVNGMSVPFHQTQFYAGHPLGEMQITSVAVNQGTPDSLFKGN